ncbi:hypothetical protein BASA81_012803 [Batrachochytrium salamandrivorans]|nr:hypothetical protein BASA81_012803 [Batrachochytrium salamandrivorans]
MLSSSASPNVAGARVGDYSDQLQHILDTFPRAPLGSERFALDKKWFDQPDQAPLAMEVNGEEGEAGVVWVPQTALTQLEEWFGPLLLTKGQVAFVDPESGKIAEVEVKPAFVQVDVRTKEEGEVVVQLDSLSVCEEIPSLVRRVLDLTPSLKQMDEEDVRLWIKSGTGEYTLVKCDYPKANVSSSSSSSLDSLGEYAGVEDEEEDGAEEAYNAVPPLTLRGALGKKPFPGQSLSLLLELREDGAFTRKLKPTTATTTKSKSRLAKPKSFVSSGSKYSGKKQSFSTKQAVKVGQRCDALLSPDEKWLEAVVVDVGASGTLCTVHFLSFSSRLNLTLDVPSNRMLPPHTKVPDWRQQLKVGDIIDLHTSIIKPRLGGSLYQNLLDRKRSTKSKWIPCSVRKIERNREDPRVTLGVGLTNKYFGPEHLFQVSMDSETIAARYTHVIRPKSFNLGPQSTSGTPPVNGIVGLRNLGNTCYMNSVVQCLSHCQVLREPFLNGEYEQDINRRNPLGMGGQLAESFASLLQQMWSNEYEVVAPNRFKLTLGQMNSQFQGFSQHDSQELLTQLLDSLHEDLNRVLKKPVTSPVESEGKTDLQVYQESWSAFKQRNESKLVSEMYGMMKSHLLCPVCKKEAVTFDAYANVSVPIPSLSLIRVDFVFLDAQLQATRCVAMLPKRSSAKALVEWLCANFNLPNEEDNVLVGELIANKVGSFFYRTLSLGSVPEEGDEIESVSTVRELSASRSLFAWQLHANPFNELSGPCAYPEVEAKWAAFWSELEILCGAPSTGGEGGGAIKEFVSERFSPELGFPFPFAQLRLVQGLRQLAKMLGPKKLMVAKEAYRMVEAEGHAAVPELVKECLELGVGELSSTSLDSGSSPLPRKSVARFLSRLFSPSPSPSSPPKDMGKTPSATVSLLKMPPSCDPNARLVVELNHFRSGKRNSRVPSFVAIQANRTWGELQQEVVQYLTNVILKGFSLPPSPSDDNNNEELFTLELDSVERVPLPYPQVPLLESLNHKSAAHTVNSLSIAVRWKHAGATDFVFGLEDESLKLQLEDNSFRVVDATLGVGQVQLHSSFAQVNNNSSENEIGSENRTAITLDQCLEAFRKREQLGKDDAWFCDRCKMHQCAYKTMDLWNTPNVLVIHLKRFLYERTLGERVQREKITDLVSFPLTGFDTRSIVAGGGEGGGVYDLFAVSNHMGGLGGGHYVAYVKSQEQDQAWWLMNDGLATKIEDESQVVSSAAYVLFYKKRKPIL